MEEDETVPSDEVRRRFRELLDSVQHHGDHVTVLRYRKPAAELVPIGWYREVCSLVADIGEWLVPAAGNRDRLAEWQDRANAVRRDIPVEAQS